MNYFLAIIIGYFIGCIQFSFLIVHLITKKDIRNLGYGNAGASNVFDRVSKRVGVLVAILDIFKAVVSMFIIRAIFKEDIQAGNMLLLYLNGASVVAGHNYPFYMKFKGGKGTASTLGMRFSIDYRLGLLCVLLVLVVTLVTDYIVIGALSMVLLLLAATIYFQFGIYCVIVVLIMLLLFLYNHRKNFVRIKNREERGLRRSIKKEE